MARSSARSRRIPGVAIERLDARAAEGSLDVWYGSAEVVVKYDSDTSAPHRPAVAIEFICTRLAMALGVPVPMGDAGTYDNRHAWVSALVTLAGETLPPADPEAMLAAAPADIARIFVFDVFIHNEDRQEYNMLFHEQVGVWAIDHEKALCGEDAFDATVLRNERNALTRWYLTDPAHLKARPDLLREAMNAIQTLSTYAIWDAVEEAYQRRLLNRAQGRAIVDFLSHRRHNIRPLVRRSLDPRQGGAQWTTPALLPGT